jgi:hypothetical protein
MEKMERIIDPPMVESKSRAGAARRPSRGRDVKCPPACTACFSTVVNGEIGTSDIETKSLPKKSIPAHYAFRPWALIVSINKRKSSARKCSGSATA